MYDFDFFVVCGMSTLSTSKSSSFLGGGEGVGWDRNPSEGAGRVADELILKQNKINKTQYKKIF